MTLPQLSDQNFMFLLIALALWTIPWKATALWRSAKNGQKIWFIILLLVNTVGILEIIYLFWLSKRKKEE